MDLKKDSRDKNTSTCKKPFKPVNQCGTRNSVLSTESPVAEIWLLTLERAFVYSELSSSKDIYSVN